MTVAEEKRKKKKHENSWICPILYLSIQAKNGVIVDKKLRNFLQEKKKKNSGEKKCHLLLSKCKCAKLI